MLRTLKDTLNTIFSWTIEWIFI